MGKSKSAITIIEVIDKESWQKDLDTYEHSVFITPQWIEAVKTNTCLPLYLDFYDSTNKIGKLSGLIINHPKSISRQLYCYSGIAIQNPIRALYNNCYSMLYTFSIRKKINRIVIGSYDQPFSLPIQTTQFFPTERTEFVINLTESIIFGSRFKRNLKKNNASSSSIQKVNHPHTKSDLLSLLLETHAIRQQKKRTKYNPFYLPYWTISSLEKLTKSQNTDIFNTRSLHKVNAAELNIRTATSVFNLLRGADQFAYDNGLPARLGKFMIDYYKERNYKRFNLGGIPSGPDGENLAIFKKSMGAQAITVFGATTNYLIYPYKLLNPLLNLGRRFPDHTLIQFLKKWI
ncbi:MAG: hypothetical protein JEZ14_05370 [Marinilabiliaceae bacterium]|nr:hypothetical protein [Marinilabiliaceae bacterium]